MNEAVTSEPVTVRQEGRVGVITIDNPPVNALGQAVRTALMAALERFEADPGIGAVVIGAAGQTFPAGADIREFGRPVAGPALPDICNRLESFPKPVVTALHGAVLGGGFELALAAHWRLAAAGTRFGFPEVTLGILPGAGGTARVPRLAGAALALDLMLTGKPIDADAAERAGLIDGVFGTDVEAAALTLAADLAERGIGLRPTRERSEGFADPAAYLREVARRRAQHATAWVPAEAEIVECIEAALLLPFEVALAHERDAFVQCLDTPEARALRHAFLAERRATKVPELKLGQAREISRAGVVGGGTMGAGIAVALLDAGIPVVLVERDAALRDAAIGRVEAIYVGALEKQRLDEETVIARLAAFDATTDLAGLAGCDLAIEAVYEDMAAKAQVLAELDAVLGPEAILATNTSYLDVDALALGTLQPGRVIGLHFFAPAQVMRLVEIVVGRLTSADTVATGFALARRMGKFAVRAGVTDGFIGNRVFSAYRSAAEFLLEDGASVEAIDAAMREAGFPLGPFEVQDLAGLDISWARRKRLAPTRDPAARYVAVGDRLCEAGRFGQKTRRGYYLYEGREARADPEVAAIVEIERALKGIEARTVGAEEIRRRTLAAMANEGARLVAEGIALRPSDVDVVMMRGYGFPRFVGGPMQWADEAGLLSVRDDLIAWTAEEPGFWQPAPLWGDLIKNGRKFADLDD